MKTWICVLAMSMVCVALTSQAAVIRWGAARNVGTSNDVVAADVLVQAYNLGGATSASNVTVNGVLFTGTSTFLGSDYNGDAFSGDTGDAAYNALLSSFDFGGGSGEFTKSVGGGKLAIGSQYQIQVWYVDDRSGVSVMRFGDGNSNTVDLASNPGQYVIGTFTADGTSQPLTLDAQGGMGNAHITAYQIRGRALVGDDFGSSTVWQDTRFTASDIDTKRWVKRDAAWSISSGALVNPALTSNDERVAHRMDSVSSTDTNLTLIMVSFDYSVGEGTTLYYHSALFTGEPSGLLARLTLVNGGFYQDWRGVFSGSEYRLQDGGLITGNPANAVASFAGGTSGTFSQTYDISGFGGGGFSVADVSYILNSFASNNDTTGGAISIDNFLVEGYRPPPPPGMILVVR